MNGHGPDPAYLDAAAANGLLSELDGHRYVAGAYTEPISGIARVLVEYCAPALIGAPGLGRALRTAFPDTATALVRVDGEATIPGWERESTYIRYTGGTSPVPAQVREATAAEEPLVRDWLARAFTTANVARGRRADQAAAVATEIVAAAGRRSYVTCDAAGRAVGHATLLTDSRDDVTGRSFVELLDTLVEPQDGRAERIAGLVAACVRAADADGQPLVGHVLHTGGDDRVLAGLLTRGWVVEHSYQVMPIAVGP